MKAFKQARNLSKLLPNGKTINHPLPFINSIRHHESKPLKFQIQSNSLRTFASSSIINHSTTTKNLAPKSQPPNKTELDTQTISRNAVIKAIVGNTFITAIKFMAYLTSGSAALLAETCHSLIDSLNQGLLYLGIKQSAKTPDQKYQYGYGRARYFYSLVSALGIWWIGSFSVMYNGIQTMIHPPPPTSQMIHPPPSTSAVNLSDSTTEVVHHHHNPLVSAHELIDKESWSYQFLSNFLPEQMVTTMMCHYGLVTPIVLLISFVIDGGVLTSVIKDLKEQKPDNVGIFTYLRTIQDPMVLAVLLEDIGKFHE